MGSQRIMLLCIIALFISIHAENSPNDVAEGMHKCPACATIGFTLRRKLMQKGDIGQSIGWGNWKGSDCDAGTVFVMPCKGSCVTIVMEKQVTMNEYVYIGSMQECSDDLIHSSPDLPRGIDFKNFHEDAIYVNKRSGHRITYNFTRQSFLDNHDTNVEWNQAWHQETAHTPARYDQNQSNSSFGDGIIMFCIVVSFLIIVCVLTVSCKVLCIQYHRRAVAAARVRNAEINLEEAKNVASAPEEGPEEDSLETGETDAEEPSEEAAGEPEEVVQDSNNNTVPSV